MNVIREKIENNKHVVALVYAAFIAGLCSIVYELLIATAVSYFLGDSVKFFSITIGAYMAAMGLGSYVSKHIDGDILSKFIKIELALGLVGGLSIPLLYFAYAFVPYFILVYLGLTMIIGFLIGLEIPFLTRLMEKQESLKVNIANILSFDYLGALIATLAFPFILLPLFGVYRSSLIFGLVNMSIGFVILMLFIDELRDKAKRLKILTIVYSFIIILMIFLSSFSLKYWDQSLYNDRIIYTEQSKYQHIVLTRYKDDIRLFLEGNLQFSSIDEHRYHESLVHVPLILKQSPVKRVLLLGAGDGLAARELLKYEDINEIIIVDLDESVIKLAKTNKYIRKLNNDSLYSKRVNVVIDDAFTYLKNNNSTFDLIIADLPDPNNHSLARLYSKQFYRIVLRNLNKDGLFVTQATSPYFATNAFWSIEKTIKASGFKNTYPYHVQIPSFGEWGFVLASNDSLNTDDNNYEVDITTSFLNSENISKLFTFSKDMISKDVEVNVMDKPVVLDYYLRGWEYYSR